MAMATGMVVVMEMGMAYSFGFILFVPFSLDGLWRDSIFLRDRCPCYRDDISSFRNNTTNFVFEERFCFTLRRWRCLFSSIAQQIVKMKVPHLSRMKSTAEIWFQQTVRYHRDHHFCKSDS